MFQLVFIGNDHTDDVNNGCSFNHLYLQLVIALFVSIAKHRRFFQGFFCRFFLQNDTFFRLEI